MRSPTVALTGVFTALSIALPGCSADQIAPPPTARGATGEWILTSFDRVTLAAREQANLKAAVVRSGALSSSGLDFVVRNPTVAGVMATRGRVQVNGLAAGQTWVVMQSAAAADSVEVVVQ